MRKGNDTLFPKSRHQQELCSFKLRRKLGTTSEGLRLIPRQILLLRCSKARTCYHQSSLRKNNMRREISLLGFFFLSKELFSYRMDLEA